MSTIALDVLPVFILIAIGWASVAVGLLRDDIGEALGDFVFRLAVPVLLFRTVAFAEYGAASPWELWAAYFAGVIVTWTAGHVVATRLFGRDERVGVVAGVSAAFANNVFIGLPLVDHVVGEEGVAALSILLSVHLPLMMITGSLMMQRAETRMSGRSGPGIPAVVVEVGRTLARNPLVIGLLLGSLVRLAGVPMDGIPRAIVDQIAGVAGPAALLSMGMSLRRYGVAGNVGLAVVIGVLKLLLMPAVIFLAGRALGLSPAWLAAMVLTSSVPTGVNAWLIANHFGVGNRLASSVITLTTAVGVATVTLWVILLER